MQNQLPKNVYDQISANRWRTGVLLFMFPLIILGLTYLGIFLALFFSGGGEYGNVGLFEVANMMMRTVGFWVIIAVFLWSFISYFAGSKMILGYAGAKPIKKSDAPEFYNAVENMSIIAGLPKNPKAYIIEDNSLNAFATGNSPENSTIAVTRGLLDKLDKAELEAVVAHEMGHIVNRDIRVMLIMITLVGAVQIIGEIMLRSGLMGGSRNSKGNNILPIIGLLFVTVGVLVGVLTKFAVSREREYLADATGAYFTSNPVALASALEKIAKNSYSKNLQSKPVIGSICLSDPTIPPLPVDGEKSSIKKPGFWKKIWSTHPPIEDRIDLLRRY
jgi:heat shock protein HtpX